MIRLLTSWLDRRIDARIAERERARRARLDRDHAAFSASADTIREMGRELTFLRSDLRRDATFRDGVA